MDSIFKKLEGNSVAVRFSSDEELLSFIEKYQSIIGNLKLKSINFESVQSFNEIKNYPIDESDPIAIFSLNSDNTHAFYIRRWNEFKIYEDWDKYHFIDYVLEKREKSLNSLLVNNINIGEE